MKQHTWVWKISYRTEIIYTNNKTIGVDKTIY